MTHIEKSYLIRAGFTVILLLTLFTSQSQNRTTTWYIGFVHDTPIEFDTWEWYGDDVDAPFPTTRGGFSLGFATRIAKNPKWFWGVDMHMTFGSEKDEPSWEEWSELTVSRSTSLPITVGRYMNDLNLNKKAVQARYGLFVGPQWYSRYKKVYDTGNSVSASYQTQLMYGMRGGLIIPISNHEIALDGYLMPAFRVSQNYSERRDTGTSSQPFGRISLTYGF